MLNLAHDSHVFYLITSYKKITSVYGVRQKSGFIYGCNSKYRSMSVVRHAVPFSKNQTSGHSVYYLMIALIF